MVKGVSGPRVCAMPMAIAVLPVPAVLCSFEGAKWLDWASQLRPLRSSAGEEEEEEEGYRAAQQ